MSDEEHAVAALARYWAWSAEMKERFEGALLDLGDAALDSPEGFDALMFMSLWYASLYVVVEGYKELKLRDRRVSLLLRSRHVDLLRGYRNGVFHYQRSMWDRRFLDFINVGGGTARWIRGLHDALGATLTAPVESMAD